MDLQELAWDFDACLCLKAELELLPAVVEFSRLFFQAKLPERTKGPQLYHLQLCISEAFTNIVRHGYAEADKEAGIVIELQVKDRLATVRLIDQGRYFDPSTAPSPDLDKPQGHGLGVFFLRELTENMHYCRQDQKNILTLTMRV